MGQLYGLVVFLVMLIGVIEASIPTGILRTILESVRAGTAPMTPILLAYGALAFPYLVVIARLGLSLSPWGRSGLRPPP
jgi:hypothetical protein